jgi:hypothetical protein
VPIHARQRHLLVQAFLVAVVRFDVDRLLVEKRVENVDRPGRSGRRWMVTEARHPTTLPIT